MGCGDCPPARLGLACDPLGACWWRLMLGSFALLLGSRVAGFVVCTTVAARDPTQGPTALGTPVLKPDVLPQGGLQFKPVSRGCRKALEKGLPVELDESDWREIRAAHVKPVKASRLRPVDARFLPV